MQRVEALGSHRRLRGANYEPWVTTAFDVINDLDIGSYYHLALIRPAYQRLMWHVAHTPVYFDTHEMYYTLLDVGERIVEGLTRACDNEPADPRELGRWTADLRVSRPDVQTPIHVHVFYETLGGSARSAYGERLAEVQGVLPVINRRRNASGSCGRSSYSAASRAPTNSLPSTPRTSPTPSGTCRSPRQCSRRAGSRRPTQLRKPLMTVRCMSWASTRDLAVYGCRASIVRMLCVATKLAAAGGLATG
jgi:hypothetical protein